MSKRKLQYLKKVGVQYILNDSDCDVIGDATVIANKKCSSTAVQESASGETTSKMVSHCQAHAKMLFF